MGIFVGLIVVGWLICMKYLINEDKNTRSQWRVDSERYFEKESERKRMGINYSPDTIEPGYVSEDELDSINQCFENRES